MKMWLKPRDVTSELLPEVNRIWKPAGIQWFVEQVLVESPAEVNDRKEILRCISMADRSTPNRTEMVMSLADSRCRHPVIHNVYFIPFIGSTSAGLWALWWCSSTGPKLGRRTPLLHRRLDRQTLRRYSSAARIHAARTTTVQDWLSRTNRFP